MDTKGNPRNSKAIAHNTSNILLVFETKNSASVIVFGSVVSDSSAMDPHSI